MIKDNVSKLLLFFLVLYVVEGLHAMDCGTRLENPAQNLSKVISSQYEELMLALREGGEGYFLIQPESPWFSDVFANSMFLKLPNFDQQHISQVSFYNGQFGLIDTDAEYMGGTTSFNPWMVHQLHRMGATIHARLNHILSGQEKLNYNSFRIGFHHKGIANKHYEEDITFYDPHIDPKAVYLRVLITFVGPGTIIYPDGNGTEPVASVAGDILILSGGGREELVGPEGLLWHQVPDSASMDLDRMIVTYDFVLKEGFIERCLRSFGNCAGESN